MKKRYFLFLFILCAAKLFAQETYTDVSGTITKNNLDMDECKVSEMQIRYHLYTQLGEPGVHLTVEWQTSGQDPDCLAGKTICYVIECHTKNAGTYAGELHLNAGSGGTIKQAGQGFGTDLSGSPDYDKLFILGSSITMDPTTDLNNILSDKVEYIDQDKAKACWKSGLAVDGIYVVIPKTGVNTQSNSTSADNSTTTGNNNQYNSKNNNSNQSNNSNNNTGSYTAVPGANQGNNQNNSSGNNNSQGSNTYYNNSQSNTNSQQIARQQEMQRKHDEIMDNYHQQQNALNDAGQKVHDAFDNLLQQNQENSQREQARIDAEAAAREQENNERHEEFLRQQAEEQAKEDAEQQRQAAQQAEWDREQAERERESQEENARIQAANEILVNKSKSVLPNSLMEYTDVKKPDEINTPKLQSVFYVIWNFGRDNQVLISKPVEIKKSPDGDWPLPSEVDKRIQKESNLGINISAHYLLGYFTNLAAASSALNDLKANAIKNGFDVEYVSYGDNEKKNSTNNDSKDFWKE